MKNSLWDSRNSSDSQLYRLIFYSNMCDHAHSCGGVSSGIFQTLSELDFEKSIFSAALNGDVTRVKLLISKDSGLPRATDSFGYTALHYAARAGHVEVCRELLQAGAEVDSRTGEGGQTALHRAALCGHLVVVQELVRAGADVGAADGDGETPLHKAYRRDHIDVINFLCSMADPQILHVQNRHGKRPEELRGNS